MVKNKKGDRRERELVNALDDAGFAVLRAPASGSATDRELPDVLAGDGSVCYAIEPKSSGGDPIYIDTREVDNLRYFANGFGATALIGVRFDYADWRFFTPANTYQVDGDGNYRVKESTAEAEGRTMEEL